MRVSFGLVGLHPDLRRCPLRIFSVAPALGLLVALIFVRPPNLDRLCPILAFDCPDNRGAGDDCDVGEVYTPEAFPAPRGLR